MGFIRTLVNLVVNLEWEESLNRTLQCRNSSILTRHTQYSSSYLIVLAGQQSLYSGQSPETPGFVFIMNKNHIASLDEWIFLVGSSMSMGISQLKQIFLTPSMPEMIDHTVEILHPPLKLLGCDLKIFILLLIIQIIWKCQQSPSNKKMSRCKRFICIITCSIQ